MIPAFVVLGVLLMVVGIPAVFYSIHLRFTADLPRAWRWGGAVAWLVSGLLAVGSLLLTWSDSEEVLVLGWPFPAATFAPGEWPWENQVGVLGPLMIIGNCLAAISLPQIVFVAAYLAADRQSLKGQSAAP